MLRSRFAPLAVVAAVALTGCGGGDETVAPSPTAATTTTAAGTTTPSEEATSGAAVAASGDLVEAFAASILESQSAAGAGPEGMDVTYSEEEAACVARQVVDGVGEDALREYGMVTPDGTIAAGMDDVEFSEADAEVVADGIIGCTDALETMQAAAAESLGADGDMGACLQDAIDEDVVRGILVASLTGETGTAAMGPLMVATMGCLGDDMTDLPTDIPTELLEELATEG